MEPTQELGPYLLLRPLGKGGMGVVYLAKTKFADHPVAALKRLRPDIAKLAGFAERFWHEGEIARRLHHPSLVATIDVGEADGRPYVVSELVVGKSAQMIADRLSDRNLGASTAVVTRILIDGAAALAYVHDARDEHGRPLFLVHRDVTPGNLLIGYDGAVKLADFGLAKSLLSENLMLTAEGAILGTPKYLPLEVVRGDRATKKADIYGLGCVAYRLLTGEPPYDGDVKEVIGAILRGPPKPIRELRPDVPPWLATMVEQMMARDLSDRPGDAGLIERELTRVAEIERQLLRRDQLGAWLVELFKSEASMERAELEELEMARTERVRPHDDPAETRVLHPGGQADAPTLIDDGAMNFGMEMPTVKQAAPKIAAPTPVAMPVVAKAPSFPPNAAMAPVSPMPDASPTIAANTLTRPPKAEAQPARSGARFVWASIFAGAIGLMAGAFWPSSENDVLEQLGKAKERIAAKGLPQAKFEREIRAVSTAIIEERDREAQLLLQDLNIAIDAAATSTRAR